MKFNVDWLANKSLPWAAYREFMSGRLIDPGKQPVVHPVGVGETLIHLFEQCMMKVTGTKATNTCQDEQLCSGLDDGIDDAVHRVQAIWYANLSTEN